MYQPRFRLGQSWSDFASGLTSGVAKDLVKSAEGPVRQIVQEERHNFATAVINGLPFFGLGTILYIGTRYFVPDDKKSAKGIGYIAAAGAGTIGAWYTASQLTGKQSQGAATAPSSGTANAIADNAAKTIVAEAEPKIRQIVDEERSRIAAAGQAGLPFAVGSVATFLATWLLVDDKNNKMKALGYTGSALLMGVGAWVLLEKEKAA